MRRAASTDTTNSRDFEVQPATGFGKLLKQLGRCASLGGGVALNVFAKLPKALAQCFILFPEELRSALNEASSLTISLPLHFRQFIAHFVDDLDEFALLYVQAVNLSVGIDEREHSGRFHFNKLDVKTFDILCVCRDHMQQCRVTRGLIGRSDRFRRISICHA